MKKVRRIVSIILSAVVTAGLAGCSGGNSGGSGGNSTGDSPKETTTQVEAGKDTQVSAQAEGKTTISYWTTNRHDQEYMTKKIAEFNDSSESIYIDFQVYADNYSQMLDLAFSTGTAPDVFQLTDFATNFSK